MGKKKKKKTAIARDSGQSAVPDMLNPLLSTGGRVAEVCGPQVASPRIELLTPDLVPVHPSERRPCAGVDACWTRATTSLPRTLAKQFGTVFGFSHCQFVHGFPDPTTNPNHTFLNWRGGGRAPLQSPGRYAALRAGTRISHRSCDAACRQN